MSSSKIRLVLSDIDGTIVPIHSHTPSKAVRDVINELKANNIRLTAATGRPYDMAKDLFLDVGLMGLNIFDAGASIRDTETGRLVWKNWLSIGRLESIAKIMFPYAHLIDFFPTQRELNPKEFKPSQFTEEAPYAWACVPLQHKNEILKQVSKLDGLSAHVDKGLAKFPGSCNIQVTDKNADKFHAVKALKEIVHSRTDETLAIGDSSNDLPLLNSAGIKVAMGNASEELRQAADYTVPSVEEDGFVEAMNRFVL